jgi:deoxyadenosine/deoxycytidine kinase
MAVRVGRLAGLSITSKNKRNYLQKIKQYDSDCALLIELVTENLKKSRVNAWQKVHRFDTYISTIIFNNLLLHEAFDQKTIVFDEGIIHNGGFKIILENYEKYKGLPESRIFPKAAIFLSLEPDQYRERLHSRFNESHKRSVNSLVSNLTESELDEYIVNSIEGKNKRLEACKLLSMPILELDAVLSKSNINKALEFINEISSLDGRENLAKKSG